eukprot:CAMPEP_0175179208 /NCGR_PEP_ID=MMETSP0087-20121206/35382_1 /TAXON_ID=136419 /ORGANISM="Unknown Unknown, Strain D1" /LENGTH=96 /DNA_ID=CAMNT_0016471407 /DNA_START=84 /DNA_END=371 /DNA_ORIENTATION=+
MSKLDSPPEGYGEEDEFGDEKNEIAETLCEGFLKKQGALKTQKKQYFQLSCTKTGFHLNSFKDEKAEKLITAYPITDKTQTSTSDSSSSFTFTVIT